MASGVMGIGTRALGAAQLGLLTAQHNIANANTDGFHRQEVVQSTALPFATGSGYIGQGTQVDTVKRIYSQFLDGQVLSAGAQASYYQAFYNQVSQVDNLVADPQAGLSPALQDFFRAVQTVADNPSSTAARQALLSAGQSLTTRFHTMYDRLAEIRNGVDTQVDAALADINAYANQIAQLNDKIVVAQSQNNQPPNDLLDQREVLVKRLNEQIKATTVAQSDGTINVFVGNGQALVVGNRAYSLNATQDPTDSEALIVGYEIGNQTVTIPESSLTGGTLGGLLAFRRSSLDDAQNALGRVAIGLANTFNTQHALGQDLNNALGGNFFTLASTTPSIYASTGNTGTASVTASIATTAAATGNLTNSSYRITYDGSNYALTDLGTSSTTTGLTSAQLVTQLSNVGVTFTISAGAAAGDEWKLLPTRFGARDISVAITDTNKIAAASPIVTAATAGNSGSATISAGVVTATASLPTATVTLTYSSASQTFTTTSGDATWNGLTIPSSGTYTAGATISVNGISFAISGSPSNGDTLTVARNTGGVGDNRNALLLGALQTSNTLSNNSSGSPTTSFQGAYSQMVSNIGNKTRETHVNYTAQTTLLDQTKASQQQLSGVNLDEEAANLIRYQQAYQASAKMIQIGSSLFDTILEIG